MVWRYHPKTREYDIFSEGSGNPFGLEFDGDGRMYSGHNGGNTRGWHYVQGGIYLKQGVDPGKFGPPRSPYSFGQLPILGTLTLMVCVLHPKPTDIEAGSLVSENGMQLARQRAGLRDLRPARLIRIEVECRYNPVVTLGRGKEVQIQFVDEAEQLTRRLAGRTGPAGYSELQPPPRATQFGLELQRIDAAMCRQVR
jgi:hypothetical protein